jgi:HlyD family secretion protein
LIKQFDGEKDMKRFLMISLILIVTIGLSLAGYQYAAPAARPLNPTEDPNVEVVEARLETLVDTVNATGRIEPMAEVEMKFEIGGVIEEVLVERGQQITAGTVLARLATDDLELEIRRAEIDLDQQEAELAKLLEPELAENIASAQAQVDSARLSLAELVAGPDQDEITKAASALKLKEVALKKAQWAYDQVAYRGEVGAMGQADELQQATLEYESALADYNIAVKKATQAEIAEAQAKLASARASLAELLKGPSAADIASTQAAIDQARLTLQEKRSDLDEAVLTAPTAGVVLSVEVEPGERVLNEADEAVMVIANTSAYLLKVEVDEIDIGKIARRQPVAITLDAFTGQTFTGQVVDISPSPVEDDSNSIVRFEVTIALDADDSGTAPLPGMTATAAIETERLDDIVVVPNRAIQIDRGSSPAKVYVEKLDDQGNLMRVEVEPGLRNGDVTQIVAGVQAGDRLIIRKQPELTGPSSL